MPGPVFKVLAPLSRFSRAVAPYVAETGAAAFVAVAVFSLVVVMAEFFSPGLVSSAVAPQTLVLCLLASAACALADVPARAATVFQRAAFAAVGVLATAFAFWASWYYFSPVPDVRARLTALIAFAVGLAFAAAAAPAPEDV